MTPEDPPVPDDDALAVAARGALGRLAGPVDAPAPWDNVRARGRRVQVMRYATVAAACLLLVLAGVGSVAAVGGGRDRVDVAGRDNGGSSTTTTSEPASSTTTTTTTTEPGVSRPFTPSSTPLVIPNLPKAQAGDFEGSIEAASTTLVAAEPMPVTLTLRNVTDHAVWVPDYPPIGLFLAQQSSTNMTGSSALFAPGETRTFTSTITASPWLMGTTNISAEFLRYQPFGGATETESVTGVPPITVTVVPPGWQPGQPLDPSQGNWNVELTSDVGEVAQGASFVVHARVTNTGTESQQTSAYGAVAVSCSVASTVGSGIALPAATLAPGETATLDVTLVADDHTAAKTMDCTAGLQFPYYDGSAVMDFDGPTTLPLDRIASNPLTVALASPSASTTTSP